MDKQWLTQRARVGLTGLKTAAYWLLACSAIAALGACGGNAGTGASAGGGAAVAAPEPVNWVAQAYLKAPNASTNNQFGTSVAVDGDTVVVGAYAEESNQTTITNGSTASADHSAAGAGAAYVFRRTGSSWVQEAYLKAPNAEANDGFGFSVGVYGDTVVVGAIKESSNQTTITNGSTASADNSASSSGAAYVFRRAGSSWAQEAYLKPPNSDALDWFGAWVAVYGDTVVVGAPFEDSNQTSISNAATASTDNSAGDAGAAYVFKRTGSLWAQEAYLKPSNADANDQFGLSLALYGDTVVVGAYTESSNQTTITNGSTASADNSASSAGAAYVFKRSGSTWVQEAYLKASNAEAGDLFGFSVALYGDTVVVGALSESSNQTAITNGSAASADNSAGAAGAAYVFKRTGSNWTQEAYLKAPNADSSDNFGASVALDGDTILVGAPGESSNQATVTNGTTASADNTATGAGAVYVFKRTGSTWARQAYIKPPNAETGDLFGYSVALSGNTLVAGAYAESSSQTSITNGTTASADNSASSAGASYMFFRQ